MAGPTTAQDVCAEIGAALLNYVSVVSQLGHSRPGDALDYVHVGLDDGIGAKVVRDFVAWTSGRDRFSPNAAEQLQLFAERMSWHRSVEGDGSQRFDQLLARAVGNSPMTSPPPARAAAGDRGRAGSRAGASTTDRRR